jgi:hypothetical protein
MNEKQLDSRKSSKNLSKSPSFVEKQHNKSLSPKKTLDPHLEQMIVDAGIDEENPPMQTKFEMKRKKS